ncbi:HAAS signaling domain-containing protein [Paenibacillus tengchongensis]|uniref:HAAS signaling domain-containing protein n=1 Tax=Paenibacillus tengchongensis TaxID=2608684 RepID=UPI00124E0DAC|nr:hypothetical protein [Paenibacillus tengchongensis]
MEMIDRYIYAVIQRLPEGQREDIRKELRGLIEDMLEERLESGQPSAGDVEQVLLQLGSPARMAAKYRGRERYLIGPAYFDSYLSTLKVVIAATLLAMTVVFAIEIVVDKEPVVDQFAQYLVSLFTTAGQAFFWVTAGFALYEYSVHSKEGSPAAAQPEWSPRDLPPVPSQRERIKLSEPVAGIFFTIIFTVVFLFGSELIGVYLRHGEDSPLQLVSFISPGALDRFLPFIAILGALGVLKEIWKIIVRRRTAGLFAYHVIYSLLGLGFAAIMLQTPGFWNPDFLIQVQSTGLVTSGEALETIGTIWDTVTDNLIYFILIITLADIAAEGYKWWNIRKQR